MDGTSSAPNSWSTTTPRNSATALSSSSSPSANNQPGSGGERDGLYDELWQTCAGASVYVPRSGEKVLYFPQGHLEQVDAFIQHQQDGHMDIPVQNMPSKILCRVVSVQLKAESYTDEVFAQVTLLPEHKQDEVNSEDTIPIRVRDSAYSFCKILTPSDTSTHGGLSVPKRHAIECFPPLDMSLDPPTQELVAKDLHGFAWQFRHIYRGQPKRHLLTSGWSTFLNAKKLAAGDTCIFIRGENGEIRVGIRRAMKQHSIASTSSSLISGDSMQRGILATAYHAVTTGSMFTVYYHPWTNPYEYIIPVQRYLKSTEMKYSIGMRVQMLLEVVESKRRYAGTIIGVDDIDGSKWPGSDWRSLKVQWDTILDSYMNAERVCPWWIEPLEFAKQKMERDLQGQDYNVVASPQPARKRLSLAAAFPPSKVIRDSKFGMENQFRFLVQDPIHQCTSSSMSIAIEDLTTCSSNVNCSESQGLSSSSASKDENDVPLGQHGSLRTYKLFGFRLYDNQPELPSPQFAINKIPIALSIPPMSQSNPYGKIPGVTSGNKCKKCRSVNSRSCTKVLKQGTALGRAIDLSRIAGYYELISELDCMFEFGGGLIDGSSGWHVTCIDDDEDIMLLGDFKWQDFQSSVRKMIICPSSSACPTNTCD